ncbi:MAG: DUF2232 domain-containing protein [Sneathiella sp.]|nr:DUF2232 domain-containing protein [Sneathiella sp.]
MIKDLSINVALGIASTLFLSLSLMGAGSSATAGNALQAVSLTILSIAPLFLSGLGWGLTGGLVSVAAGAVITGIFISPLLSVTYILTCGLPVLVIVRQALLWREKDGVIFWYPIHRLMVCWILVTIAFSCMAALLLYTNDELREGLLIEFGKLISQFQKQGNAFDTVTPEDLIWYMPQIFGPFWGINVLISGCLAQGVLTRFKKNIRPSPEFSGLQMPKWLAALTIVMMTFSLINESSSLYLGMVVFTLGIVFFLQGMAVIHRVSSSWNYRSLVLTAVYLIMILMFWPVFVIMLLGLTDSWFGFRGRALATPNQEED